MNRLWLQIDYDNIYPIYALSIFYYTSIFIETLTFDMNVNKMQSINGLLRNRKTMSQLFWFRHFDRFSGEFLIGTEFSII